MEDEKFIKKLISFIFNYSPLLSFIIQAFAVYVFKFMGGITINMKNV